MWADLGSNNVNGPIEIKINLDIGGVESRVENYVLRCRV